MATSLKRHLQRGVVGAGGVADFGVAGLPGGDQDEAVVGRGVAVDGDAVERHVGHVLHQLLHQRRRDRRVGRQIAEHGRHVGVDHAGALGDAGHRHRLAADLRLAAGALGDDVGGHDRVRGVRPVIGREVGLRGGQRGQDLVDRQRLQDHPGGKRQHLFGIDAHERGHRLAGRRAR
jgi:hypothetical protein